MENNRYAQHKKEIHEISMNEGVDIGTACAMLRQRMGWTFPEGKDTEITEFTAYINGLSGKEVNDYFSA